MVSRLHYFQTIGELPSQLHLVEVTTFWQETECLPCEKCALYIGTPLQ